MGHLWSDSEVRNGDLVLVRRRGEADRCAESDIERKKYPVGFVYATRGEVHPLSVNIEHWPSTYQISKAVLSDTSC